MRLSVEELEQPDDHRGLTVKQWAIVAATAIGAIFWVFVVSPQSNYWGTTGTFFISAEGEPPLIFKPDSDGYSAAKAELEDFHRADAPGLKNDPDEEHTTSASTPT